MRRFLRTIASTASRTASTNKGLATENRPVARLLRQASTATAAVPSRPAQHGRWQAPPWATPEHPVAMPCKPLPGRAMRLPLQLPQPGPAVSNPSPSRLHSPLPNHAQPTGQAHQGENIERTEYGRMTEISHGRQQIESQPRTGKASPNAAARQASAAPPATAQGISRPQPRQCQAEHEQHRGQVDAAHGDVGGPNRLCSLGAGDGRVWAGRGREGLGIQGIFPQGAAAGDFSAAVGISRSSCRNPR